MLCSRFARALLAHSRLLWSARSLRPPLRARKKRFSAISRDVPTDPEMPGPAPGTLNVAAPYATAARQQADGTDIAEISGVYGLGVVAHAF